jgi:aldehyde:ferredoxin oxidoreductase
MSPEMLRTTGDRICNLKKAFNIREGWTSADDWLPKRVFRDPIPSGPGQGVRMQEEELRVMIEAYYTARGWTPDGLIPAAKLAALGLEDMVRKETGIEGHAGSTGD